MPLLNLVSTIERVNCQNSLISYMPWSRNKNVNLNGQLLTEENWSSTHSINIFACPSSNGITRCQNSRKPLTWKKLPRRLSQNSKLLKSHQVKQHTTIFACQLISRVPVLNFQFQAVYLKVYGTRPLSCWHWKVRLQLLQDWHLKHEQWSASPDQGFIL